MDGDRSVNTVPSGGELQLDERNEQKEEDRRPATASPNCEAMGTSVRREVR